MVSSIELGVIICESIYIFIWMQNSREFYNIWKHKLKIEMKYLFKSSVFFGLMPIQMLDYIILDTLTLNYFGSIFSIGYSLAMFAAGFGLINFYFFALLIFEDSNNINAKYRNFRLLIIITCILFLISKIIQNYILNVISLILYAVIGTYIGNYMFYKTLKLIHLVENPLEKNALVWISISSFSFIISSLFFILDMVLYYEVTSFLAIIGWLCSIFTSIGINFGFLYLPKRANKKRSLQIKN